MRMRAGGFQFCKRVLSVCLSVLNKSTPLLDWFDASLLSNLLVLSEPCSKDDANDSIEGKALTAGELESNTSSINDLIYR